MYLFIYLSMVETTIKDDIILFNTVETVVTPLTQGLWSIVHENDVPRLWYCHRSAHRNLSSAFTEDDYNYY